MIYLIQQCQHIFGSYSESMIQIEHKNPNFTTT